MKLLVAAPTYDGKEYAFQRWLDAVNAIPVPHDLLIVDNSADWDFRTRWALQCVPIIHLDVAPREYKTRETFTTPEQKENVYTKRAGWQRIAESMEYIRNAFLEGGYDYWLNIETDVIAPPFIADFLLARCEGVDWLNVPYKARARDVMFEYGFGCALFSRRMMEQETFLGMSGVISPDGDFYEKIRGKWRFEIVRSAVRLEHLSQ